VTRLALGLLLLLPAVAMGQDSAGAEVMQSGLAQLAGSADDPQVSSAVRWIVLLTSLSLIPGVVLLMTPFTRFVIVFSLLRQALGLQQAPPNQVLVGLALILSLAVMQPTVDEVNDHALQPYLAGELTTGQAVDAALGPMRHFMLSATRREDLQTAIRIARISRPRSLEELPTTVVVTGYVLSELETAFVTAIKVYLPFLVVDLVVASILLGTGMMMLPPVVISLPFKLLLFVLMDGWSLLVLGLVGASR
jgi:flagellar biosynthetic protein FliP